MRKPRVYKLLDGSKVRVYSASHNTFELQRWPDGSQIESIFDANNRMLTQTIRSAGEECPLPYAESPGGLRNEIWIMRCGSDDANRQSLMGPKIKGYTPKIAYGPTT